jgi:hypothetical protein
VRKYYFEKGVDNPAPKFEFGAASVDTGRVVTNAMDGTNDMWDSDIDDESLLAEVMA